MTKRIPSRKTQIIMQATRLFSRDGFDKVTTKDLARACEITEPALYRHFPSKEAIYEAVLDSLGSRLKHETLFASLEDEQDLNTILSGIARHIMEFFLKHREPYRLLLYASLCQHAKSSQIYRLIRAPYVKFLKEALDRLYKAKLVRKKNNEVTARCFVGMVFDCTACAMFWKKQQAKKCQAELLISNNVPIFVDGLRRVKKAGRSKSAAK